ncbi:MAG: hypothetical protein AAGK23_07210 [Pseudomonadota bacterium]
MKAILFIIAIITAIALLAGIYITPVRNLILAVGYERSLDTYSATDTTLTSVTSTQDAQGRNASLLSAFFGLDDALPALSSRVVCPGAAGKDGMPVIFSHEVDLETLEPGDFKVTKSSGDVGEIVCLTLAPADDLGELRTVLLVGQYGSIDDPPIRVEIIGNLLSLDNTLNFKGAKVDVIPLEAGPTLVWAEVIPQDEWALETTGTSIPFGGGNGCPAATKQIVRATWAGGISKPEGRPVDDIERQLYEVEVIRRDQTIEHVAPIALADLGDGDNNHKLCLDTVDKVTSISFPAGYLTDPRDDLNPETGVLISK